MFSFFSEIRTAQKLSGQRFHVIFFAENGYYFQYYRYLFEALVDVPSIKIAYITSDKKDDILRDTRVQSFYLKNTLAGIFPQLQADVMIMTMPDLQNFIFKRSITVKKYVYVFHALVSTHQQYRTHAFDHYDAIFCTGPQQEAEIRETEKLYALPQKECVPFGYPLLNDLQKKAGAVQTNKILIAPSWYSEGILATCILPLVEALQKEAWQLWIRPHPEFIKRSKKIYEKLLHLTKVNKDVHLDTSPSVLTHLLDAEFLITDRSGIALEYALSTTRPVLFIDTPLKVQNNEVNMLSLPPLENAVRHRLGLSVQPGSLEEVAGVLQALRQSSAGWKTSIEDSRDAIVYPPACHKNGINYLLAQLSL